MIGRIAVAFDGSDSAQDALVLALRLRDRDDGRLTLACAPCTLVRHGAGGEQAEELMEGALHTSSSFPAKRRRPRPLPIPSPQQWRPES